MSLLKNDTVAVITGTNSNLGVNIAYRLLEGLDSEENVTLVVTSRTLPRAKEVIGMINKFAIKLKRKGYVEFDYLLVDFTDMVSVLSAYYDLNNRYKKIHYLYINAAQGVYDGIDWIQATKEVLTNPIEGVTNPTYKVQRVGAMSDDGLGFVFQANVFGPYYFIHKLLPLLKGGRIIWISSLMSQSKYLSFNDMQLLKSDVSYEGSKRLVDLMHFGVYERLLARHQISQYLVHPGIFTSFSFLQYLNFFTYYGMLCLFYLARFLGSTVHNISGYAAANSAMASTFNDEPQNLKIGSSTSKLGKEFLTYEEVDSTGAEDVVAYLDNLCNVWDVKFKDQIVNTRIP